MGTLYVVSTPIGNLEDVTRRAGEVLARASKVLAEDTRRARILLDHLEVNSPLRSLHQHNEEARVEDALESLQAGDAVALVSDAGTPVVSDPGARLVAAAADAGHRIVPVPGPSAVLAALVASGFPGDRFTFLGFPPRKGAERSEILERAAGAPETTVLFEAPGRLTALLGDLESLAGPERRVVVAREMTKMHEEFFRGTIAEARRYYEEHPPRGELTLVLEAAAPSRGTDQVDEGAARALARALLREGRRPSRAARDVARRLGIPRNRAYEIVHELPGLDDAGGAEKEEE